MPDVDIMERANKYYELLEDLREKAFAVQRVAIEGSGQLGKL